jgi:hypothetical protein
MGAASASCPSCTGLARIIPNKGGTRVARLTLFTSLQLTSNDYQRRCGNVLLSPVLATFSPCLLGLPPLRRISTGQSVISKSLSNRCSAALLHAGVSLPLFFARFFMTKLYVGNLPFTATEDAVRNLFAPHGTVEKLALINDRDTGRPRGFGFLEMSSADASRAMQALNGKDFDGRALKINEAQDKPRSSGGNSRY